MKKALVLLFLLLLLSGCVATPPETTPPTTETTAPPTTETTAPPPLFPGSPKSQPVKMLMGEITLDRLVESYWSRQIRLADGTVCYVSIPQITPFSQEAVECQKEIYGLFRQYLQKALDTAGVAAVTPWDSLLPLEDLIQLPQEKEVRYYTYSAAYCNGVFSILVRADGHLGSDMPYPPSTPYSVYNLPVTEAHILPDPLRDSVKWTLERHYMNTYSPEDSVSAADYNTGMSRTLQYYAKSLAFYREGGRISIVGNVYPPGSAEPVQQVANIVSKPGGYMPEAEIIRNYDRSWWTTFIYEGTLYDRDTTAGVTTVVHPGPVKLQVRTRDHWYYTLEEDPGTVYRKDRATQTEEVLLSVPDSAVTDLTFFGYEHDGVLFMIYDERQIQVMEIPELTCTAVPYNGNAPILTVNDITKGSNVFTFRFRTSGDAYLTYSITEEKLIDP